MAELKKFNKLINEAMTGLKLRTKNNKKLNLPPLYAIKAVSRNNPKIEDVKKELLKITGMENWEDFIRTQRQGECTIIAHTVKKLFPKFDIIEAKIKFSDKAISQMEKQEDSEMYTCTHYLNMYKDKLYDFGKGTNCYEDIYVLDGVDDIFSCEISEDVKNNYFLNIEKTQFLF